MKILKVNKSIFVKNFKKKAFFLFLIFSYVQDSLAEEDYGMTGGVNLSTRYNSNILRNLDEESGTSVSISPDISLYGGNVKSTYGLEYAGEYSKYDGNNSKYDYNNHKVNFIANFEHSVKFKTSLTAEYQDTIEEPGINNQSTVGLNTFNQYKYQEIKVKQSYGRDSSQGQLIYSLDYNKREFKKIEQKFRDVERFDIEGQFFYRAAPNTRLLLDSSISDIEYLNTDIFDQSSRDYSLMIGAEYKATAKLNGSVKAGYRIKKFKDGIELEDVDLLSYSIDSTWSPNTFTSVSIGLARSIHESAQLNVGSYIRNSYTISAEHSVTERLRAYGEFQFYTYDIELQNDRKDIRSELKIGARRNLKSWMEVMVEFIKQERKSDLEQFKFDAHIVQIGIELNVN